jgi:hypothetical protein
MNAVWIPVGSAVAIILLSLGVLEVLSQGVRVAQSPTGLGGSGNRPRTQGRPF